MNPYELEVFVFFINISVTSKSLEGGFCFFLVGGWGKVNLEGNYLESRLEIHGDSDITSGQKTLNCLRVVDRINCIKFLQPSPTFDTFESM